MKCLNKYSCLLLLNNIDFTIIYNDSSMKQKIVFLRGKVGSGKTTVAKELQRCMPTKTAIFERDYFMHKVIPWENNIKLVNKVLLKLTCLYLENNYNLIIEGTFTNKEDSYLIEKLRTIKKDGNVDLVFIYLNSSLETSLKRNTLRKKGKDIKDEWIKKWHKTSVPGKINNEKIINTDNRSLKTVVKEILKQ
jgi:predicted ABC-type ATPase